MITDNLLTLSDGRRLAYCEWGAPTGRPVFLLHGSPGSRVFSPDDYRPDRTSADCGVRLITFDRPGYGKSDPREDFDLLEWTADLAELADALRIGRFAVASISAGSPYAMAAAVALPERVTKIGLVSSLAPPRDVPRDVDDWPERAEVLALLDRDARAAVPAVSARAAWLVERPEMMGDPTFAPAAERPVLEDTEMSGLVVGMFREAGRQGVIGYVWDWIAINRAWRFSPADIEVPTFIWHGELDEILPIANFEYLARTIPGCHATVWKGDGHLAMVRGPHWGEVLSAIT